MPDGLTALSGFAKGFAPTFAAGLQQNRARTAQLEDQQAREKALAMLEEKKYQRSTYDPASAAWLMGVKPEEIPTTMDRVTPGTVATYMQTHQKKPTLGRIRDVAHPSWTKQLPPAALDTQLQDEASLRFYSQPYDAKDGKTGTGAGGGKLLPVTEIENIGNRQEGLSSLRKLRVNLDANKDTMGPIDSRALRMRSMVGDTSPDVIRFQKSQALYNDVRQAIGKAKEGGVLRKEDEIKYEKILGDPNLTYEGAVAILDELEGRYSEDYDRRVGNLSASGYDVPELFSQKGRRAAPAQAKSVDQMSPEERQRRKQELLNKKNGR